MAEARGGRGDAGREGVPPAAAANDAAGGAAVSKRELDGERHRPFPRSRGGGGSRWKGRGDSPLFFGADDIRGRWESTAPSGARVTCPPVAATQPRRAFFPLPPHPRGERVQGEGGVGLRRFLPSTAPWTRLGGLARESRGD